MKLRNKKTGEIKEYGSVGATTFGKGGVLEGFAVYDSLAELNAEWEDYEEPGEYWRITDLGEVKSIRLDQHHQNAKKCKQIGNYFDTKEEAEKAVEKLKAWKRLKDKGFRFNNFVRDAIYYEINDEEIKKDIIRNDLDLLFGGEEWNTN